MTKTLDFTRYPISLTILLVCVCMESNVLVVLSCYHVTTYKLTLAGLFGVWNYIEQSLRELQQLDLSTHRLSGLIRSPDGLIREIHSNMNEHTHSKTPTHT